MSNRLLSLAVFAMVLASCSGGTSGVTPTVASPMNSLAAAIDAAANRPCPTIGQTVVHDKVSAKVLGMKVALGSTGTTTWEVSYKNLTESEANKFPSSWKPSLLGCGERAVGIGTINVNGLDLNDACVNHVCNGYVKLTVVYKPRATLPGNKPFKSVLVKFTPPASSKLAPFHGIVITVVP